MTEDAKLLGYLKKVAAGPGTKDILAAMSKLGSGPGAFVWSCCRVSSMTWWPSSECGLERAGDLRRVIESLQSHYIDTLWCQVTAIKSARNLRDSGRSVLVAGGALRPGVPFSLPMSGEAAEAA